MLLHLSAATSETSHQEGLMLVMDPAGMRLAVGLEHLTPGGIRGN